MIEEGGQAHPMLGGDVFAGTPYRLVRALGRSGSSEVFLVEHWELGREMVAKVLHTSLVDDARELDRVRLEATTFARLDHPNVAQISDFRHAADGRPFLVVEHLQGRSLGDELAERGALGLFDALDFAHQALSGLAAAHALGIAHRDVNPHNLFLAKDRQGALTLKVRDFGLARVLPSAPGTAPQPLSVRTESGAVFGSPRYLSPEAARGQRVDHRADLYAVTLILYEMVAGCGPFDRLPDVLAAHRCAEPPPPSQLSEQPIPIELDAVIQRGLRKEPGERFQTARELQQELERLWHLLHQSHAFRTTYFSVRSKPVLKSTGDLPKHVVEPFTPALGEELSSALAENPVLSAAHGTTQSRPRVNLAALSVLVALVTAAAVASGIVTLLSKAGP
jgi:serine/threonine-protein kinase